MTKTSRPSPSPDRGEFAQLCGWLAIACCCISAIAVLVADFIVSDNDMVADTISAMAAGPNMWVAEIGIYAFAFSFMALGLGAAAAHPGGWQWSLATFGFVALGVIVFLIGFRDEYGDGDRMTSEAVHMELVYTLAAVLALSTWLASLGGKAIDRTIATHLSAMAIVWSLCAPIFVFLPTAYDGLYERFLGALAIAIVVSVSRLLLLSRQTVSDGADDPGLPDTSLGTA